MGILQKWGIGAELTFDDGRARVAMGRSLQAVRSLRQGLQSIAGAASQAFGGLGQAGLAVAPVAAGAGLLLRRSVQLASTFEDQRTVMRLMVGDVGRADSLLASLVQRAATTPFSQGDLIEGSKRLLRLTGDNTDRNLELMDVMMTMAALNPTKNVVDATEALLDATSGGGFERLKEFGVTLRASDFEMQAGDAGFAEAVTTSLMDALQRQTRGADVVGALGQTFRGRMSSLVDAIDNTLRPLGDRINARLGPALEGLIGQIDGARDKFVQAIDRIMTKGDELWARFGAPVVTRLGAAWTSLGTEGQVALLALATGAGAAAAGLASMAPVLGVVGFAVSGIASAVSAVAGIGLSAELLPVIAIAAAAAVAIGLLGAALVDGFALPGESAMQTMSRVLGEFVAGAQALWTDVGPGLMEFASGFMEAFGGDAGLAISELGDQLYALMASLGEFMAVLTPDGSVTTPWRMLGLIIGHVVGGALQFLGEMMEFVIALFDVGRAMVEPLLAAIIALSIGLGGLADGSLSFGEAFTWVIRGLSGLVLGFFQAMGQSFLGVGELFLRAVATIVRAVPGLGGLLGLEGSFGADAIGELRRSMSRQLTEATLGTELASLGRDQAAADPAPVFVDAPITTHVAVDTSVRVDSGEIARAGGGAAVRDSERGIGAPLAAPARGRILRRGLEVRRLTPTEVQ